MKGIASSNFRDLLSNADKFVEEYLLFRGFMQTHRAFVSECSRSGDRLSEFQVDKIVEELLRHLTSYNFEAMMDLWNFLDQHYMVRLEHRYGAAVKHLELSLQRFYLVNAIQCGQHDRVREVLGTLLEKNGDQFHAANEWTSWCALPYLKDAASSPAFKSYFTKDWASLLVVSIHNVLTTALQLAPLPALLSVAQHAANVRLLESTVSELEDKIRSLALAQGDARPRQEPALAATGFASAPAALDVDRADLLDGIEAWPHESEPDETDGPPAAPPCRHQPCRKPGRRAAREALRRRRTPGLGRRRRQRRARSAYGRGGGSLRLSRIERWPPAATAIPLPPVPATAVQRSSVSASVVSWDSLRRSLSHVSVHSRCAGPHTSPSAAADRPTHGLLRLSLAAAAFIARAVQLAVAVIASAGEYTRLSGLG